MNKDNLVGAGIGLGIGLIAGAVVALLFAPQSGDETRAQIKEKIEKLKDK
jgi:gas vesicle protein